MSIIYFDGFDTYGNTDDLYSRWNITENWKEAQLIPGRFGGQALRLEFFCGVTKVLPNAYGNLTVGCSFRFTGQAPCLIMFGNQCTLEVWVDGSIRLHNGIWVGTIIAHSGVGAIPLNTWVWLEGQITFGTVGHYNVWVDGLNVLSGQGNTQGSNTPYCDNVTFRINWNIFEDELYDIDDVYISNDYDAPPQNANNYGAWRVELKQPSADTDQRDLSPQSPVMGQYNPTLNSRGSGANYGQSLVLQPIVSRVTGLVTSGRLYWVASSPTVKVKCVVYTDQGGAPYHAIAVSNEVVGVLVPPTQINVAVDYTFPTPPVLLRGRTYWIGYIIDSALDADIENVTGAVVYHTSITYASGAPTNPVLTAVTDKQIPMTFQTTTNANYPCVNEAPVDDDNSYVTTEVGGEDIYLLPQWYDIPDNVWAVNVVSRARKETAGAVWYQHRIESEWTDFHGIAWAPGIEYNFHVDLMEHDPNTGAAWTGEAVNAIRLGFTVSLGDAPPHLADSGIVPQPFVRP
jgi:hypothetical protein